MGSGLNKLLPFDICHQHFQCFLLLLLYGKSELGSIYKLYELKLGPDNTALKMCCWLWV